MAGKKKFSVVLGGGGAKGAFEAGVLLALEEAGLNDQIVMVSGTSIGALNGAVFVQDGAEALVKLWRELDPEKEVLKKWIPFLPHSLNALYGMLFKKGLMKPDNFHDLVRSKVDAEKLAADDTRYCAVSVNYETLETVYAEAGKVPDEMLSEYIIASANLWLIFPLFEIDGEYYTDGGVRVPFPLRHSIETSGVKNHILVIPDTGNESTNARPGSFPEYAIGVTDVMFQDIYEKDIEADIPKGHRVYRVEQDRHSFSWGMDFSRDAIEDSIQYGYEKGRELADLL